MKSDEAKGKYFLQCRPYYTLTIPIQVLTYLKGKVR